MEISKEFYSKNYNLFSDTRFCLWDVVKNFSKNFKSDSKVLDAGCGNGKNIKYFNDTCNIVGIDNCIDFVNICNDRGYNVIYSDIRNLPFENNSFDFIISIAVIHHFDKEDDRLKSINELIRVLKPGGKLLFTVWAFESDEYSKKKNFKVGHNIIKFNKSKKYYYIYNRVNFEEFCNYTKGVNTDISWDRGNWNCIMTKN